jgi:glycerophosphoryl diester phosphodiesterase
MGAGGRPRCIAHRGGSLEHPENTLRAFRHAEALGCDAIELDLRMTADGVVVVLHDPEVDRVTDGTGPVAGLTLAEVRELDAAHWFAPGHGPSREADAHPLRGGADDLRIPTLEEVLAAFPSLPIVMDLKVGPPELPGFTAAVVALLAEHDRRDDVIVGSFDQGRLDAFRALAPGIPTSASQDEVVAFWQGGPAPAVEGFAALQVPATYAGIEVVTGDLVERAHAVGIEVHVWTVDEPGQMRALVDLGVDAIMSDVPTLLVDTLRTGGAGSPPPTG